MSDDKIRRFREAHASAYSAGYNGSKREFCELVLTRPGLFAAGLPEAAGAWERYMEPSGRADRRQRLAPYVDNDGSTFRNPERVR